MKESNIVEIIFFRSEEILGTSPLKNIRVSARKYYDNKLLYDVTYTINKEGLKLSPLCVKGLVVVMRFYFFGCSFMYGEGLNDDQTLPFLWVSFRKEKYIILRSQDMALIKCCVKLSADFSETR